jgi:predicted lipoprotein
MSISSKTAVLTAFLVSVSLVLVSFSGCTIVKHQAPGQAGSAADKPVSVTSDGSFDAKSYVASNWSGKIVPELANNAVELRDILSALSKDSGGAEQKYGRRQEETAPFNFIVKGDAVIRSVNTESAAGYLELELADVSGEGKVRVQIGPVFKSSAVRDVLSFIHFGDFVNQIDFANISREINFYVRDHVVSGLPKTDIAGKHFSFVGAFSEDSSGAVLITPVEASIEK